MRELDEDRLELIKKLDEKRGFNSLGGNSLAS
jgi:hypothetical protein